MRTTLQECRRRDGLARNAPLRLLVACSGGRDSIALLGLLGLVTDADRLLLSVGHVDHGLRAASADEANHVQRVSERLGVACAVQRLELDGGAPGLPARARQARHAALRTMAEACGAARVVLAHTATDQAETVLLHLSRGAGLRGLAAMRAVEPGVARPLLEVPRARTGPLCERLGLAYIDDPTNLDLDHPRVRVRERVLPELGQLRGGIESALAASARAAHEADEALAVWVDREQRARHSDRGWDLAGWRGLPRAVRVRLVQAIAMHAGVPTDGIGRRTLDTIDQGLLRGGAKRWTLSGGRALVSDGQRLSMHGPVGVRTPPDEAT